jgi:hypothetical protein
VENQRFQCICLFPKISFSRVIFRSGMQAKLLEFFAQGESG